MMKRETISYAGSADSVAPLLADVAYIADGKPKPLLLVMHGYGGGRQAVDYDLTQLGPRGVFAVAPDMRGRGGSAGSWDAGGLDVHDIADAALAAIARHPGEIDARNINLVGYSGGGGNAFALGCRFPDLLNTSVSFFGIPDYGGWYRSNGRPDCNEWTRAAIGSPDEQPARFEARNVIPAAGNAKATKWWALWDVEEKDCPAHFVETWLDAAREAGVRQVKQHTTKPGDAKRWKHAYRNNNRDLDAADDLFLPDVFAPPAAGALALPTEGTLVVPGYVVTRRFSVFLGDGTVGIARVRYKLHPDRVDVDVIENARNLPVRISYVTPTRGLPV